MRSRALAALALTVAALGAFVWLVERDMPSSDERRERADRVVPTGVDGVTGLTIERSGRRAVLSKQAPRAAGAASWWLEAPVSARADGGRVEALVQALGSLEKRRELGSIDAASSGLLRPDTRIRIRKGEEKTVLVVGRPVPATSDVIIEVDGVPLVVSNEFLSLLEEDPGDWRSRDLFPVSPAEVQRVTLTDRDGSVVLTRHDDGFVLEAPVEDEASEPDVRELLETLVSLEVGSFVDDLSQPEANALEPGSSVRVETDGGAAPMVLELGEAVAGSDEVSALIAGQRITIGSDLLGVLARPRSSWQSRAWSTFRPFEIERAVLQLEATSFVLEEREGQWLRDDAALGASRVNEFLERLTDLEGEVIEKVPADAENVLVLSVEISGNGAAELLDLWQSNSGFVAQRQGRQFALVLSDSLVTALLAAIDELRSAEPMGAAAEAPVSQGSEGQTPGS